MSKLELTVLEWIGRDSKVSGKQITQLIIVLGGGLTTTETLSIARNDLSSELQYVG